MLTTVAARIIQALLVVAVMSLLVFAGVYVIGNPLEILVSPQASQQDLAQATAALGLDRPLHEQYLSFLRRALQGDLGISFVSGLPALPLVLNRLPATLELAVTAMLIAMVIGIPLGILAGLAPRTRLTRLLIAGSVLGFSLPTFWLGMMLITVFSVMLGWLPPVGRGETAQLGGVAWSFLTADGLRHLILPACTLALFQLTLLLRLARTGTREVAQLDYVRFARAKGLAPIDVVIRHILPNVLMPLITVAGMELGALIGFAVVTETVYAWPGMGKLLIDSIAVLDRPVVVAYLLVVVLVFVLINAVVDVLHLIVDPRMRAQRAQ